MAGLLMVSASMWLGGRWLPPGYPAAPTSFTNASVDIFGQALTVGSKVKLIGTITAIDPRDAHFQDVTFTPDYPLSGIVLNQQGVAPQQQTIVSVKCHPLQLVKVGSTL